MRYFYLTLVLLINVNTALVFAQSNQSKQNNLRIESGPAFTGSGDLVGISFYNEYSRLIGKRFKFSPGIGLLNFYEENSSDIQLSRNANALSFELAGYYLPISIDKFYFELGLGGYYRSWQWTYATGDQQYFSTGGITMEPNSYLAITKKGLGYSVSIGSALKINETLYFNLRGVYQIDNNGYNALTGRFGINIKF